MSENETSPTGKPIIKLPPWLHIAVTLLVLVAGAVPDIAGAPEWLQDAGHIIAVVGLALLGSSPELRKRPS